VRRLAVGSDLGTICNIAPTHGHAFTDEWIGRWHKKCLENRRFRLVESSASPRICHHVNKSTALPESERFVFATPMTAMGYG
jgi:hypothetical protein